ncbi:Tetratricopeptide repeat protein [anaerobic digester metagenome]
MARFELGSDKPEAALPYIQKAVKLAPANADYRFWEGVTWWALMKPDKEKAAYEKALSIDPNHLSANLYLAHNMLDRGKNSEALKLYDKVLALNPEESQAMFNKAVVLERLKRPKEMKLAMHRYLESYPDAPLARQGVRMLNKADDFTWRNHPMGQRNVALRAVDFKPGTADLTEEAKDSLNRVGDILSENPGLNLNVIAYVKGNESLARDRAVAVQQHVSRRTFGVGNDRLAPRWFGKPETVKSDGRTHVLAESVNIFTKIQNP